METSEKFYPIEAVKKIPKDVLSANEKLTLLLLLDYRRCETIYVSAETLAEQGSLGVSTVHRALRHFQQLGIIKTQKVRSGNRYRYYKQIDLPAIKALSSSEFARSSCELDLDFEDRSQAVAAISASVGM